ncbi:HpcH/HpaI aldolase/citrate lyase family protein [Amycolatopsis taiwanensis]|uniref:HpcH/HpaI aldolase/citrate lyase family protein n=1 Tax=Amycolatopsis taiwanensis TaxID=342230 RepID=UPI000481ED58|nr:CoA ester lyase [Amycolatopsis taiwanensis]
MIPPLVWLYVPGDRPERFAKALAAGADAVIIDLEDAVSAAKKDEARANVVDFLSRPSPGDGPEIQVRINDLATERGQADLAAIAGLPGLRSVRLPKVESPETLDVFARLVPDPAVGAYALVESARGLAAIGAIAGHPRASGLALGEQDLMAELSVTGESALDYLRMQAVIAAASAGLPPVAMSVYANVADETGLLRACEHGRTLGMRGMAAIHPRQIPAIRRAFRPTDEEVARAREIVLAAEQAGANGAALLPDGRFVDAPIVIKAQRVLELAGQNPS